jgi:pimeloyl-ACP methyl ester carboxylesterase
MDIQDVRVKEEPLLFGNARSLMGVITDPPKAPRDENFPAIIFLNAGIVHRIGPHRIFVKMARSLANLGFVVLRFDHSGIGDSKARNDRFSFEQSSVSETREAMDCLSTIRGSKRFVLVGLCSGTPTSFRTACLDPRVVGLILLNGVLESPDKINQDIISYVLNHKIARSYWQGKLFHPPSWLKMISGKANYKQIVNVLISYLRDLFVPDAKAPFGANHIVGDLRSLIERGVKLLFVYSEGTAVLEYFRMALDKEIRKLRASEKVKVQIIQRTDHTFTLLRHQEELLGLVCDWARDVVLD